MSNGCRHCCSDLLENLWVMICGCYSGTLHSTHLKIVVSQAHPLLLWHFVAVSSSSSIFTPAHQEKTKHLLVWQKKHVFVCVNGWMRLECKAVWVVSGTRKALNKCSPLSIFPASKFPKSWSDWDAYPASKQIKQTPNTTGHSQRPKWYLWHNIRLVVLLLWLIGAIYVKIKTLQTAVHV